ncbi:TIGR00289 family protein [Methanobacterium sp.]|uniref:diphthine--ammonia ligase n=1 Tax=Methanobacterium sp. TaxID=2164 RepID=UPI0025E07384|nr:TIGR00289 family protein [Methanobacterium sp.]MBI5460398.1 TIGR00289 family protein [Methanobacterium sp.]MDY9922368.1 TIGR00289 family protein [Methanobacterium sp.]
MNAAVLFSGGKDSTMAAYKAMEDGWKVEYLLSMHSENPHSYMFHVPNVHLTQLLSQAMEIPLIQAKTPGEKEEELEDLRNALLDLKNRGIEAVFTGAIHSEYQKSRIDGLCKEVGLESHAPLWHRDPLDYMQEIIDLGFKVIVTSASAEGLDESWLGRIVDEDLLEELNGLHEKYGLHMAFEGGEAETLVLDGPIFKKRLNILDSENVWEVDSGYMVIKDAELSEKD